MSLFLAAALGGGMLFSQIVGVYAARPRAPFVTYTIRRQQQTPDGLPDLEWSYTNRVWYRAADSSALQRRDFRGRLGALEFVHVSFNGPWDPGPPTADPFGFANDGTARAGMATSGYRTIASVVGSSGPAYDVTSAQLESGQWHLRLKPLHVPNSYILRELWANAATLELQKAVVADKLFIAAGPVYDQLDTMTFALVNGHEVITHIHARANFDEELDGDGSDVDYDFTDIAFPAMLPDWYFQPASYGSHMAQAPAR